jgi:eukaryotic-like serine/threonine-protein kinase
MSVLVEPEVIAAGAEVAPGYVVVDLLNRGRLLDVYHVWSEERDCSCVAKTIRPDRHDAAGRLRLLNEGRLLLELIHPHIVRAYELFERPRPILVVETLPGMTLEYLIREQGRQSTEFVLLLGRQLCSAMAYLHRKGFLHCDLKPGNIVISFGIVRVIDLSLARPPGRGHRGAGTHDYLAPEQARGSFACESADVWGIGAVLWEVATGERAFRRGDPDSPGYAQLERRAQPIARVRRLPAELADAIDACLDPDPAGRPPVGELGAIFDSLIEVEVSRQPGSPLSEDNRAQTSN